MSEFYEIAHGWRDKVTGEIVEEWYSPAEIKFARPQVIWLLTYLDFLESGEWPPLPRGDEYRNHNIQPNAYFTTPVLIAAEVSTRLGSAGWDGELVRLYYKSEVTLQEVAKVGHLPLIDVINTIRRCINYISGFKRRRETYQNFIRYRKKRMARLYEQTRAIF